MKRWLRQVLCGLRSHTTFEGVFVDTSTLAVCCKGCGALIDNPQGYAISFDAITLQRLESRRMFLLRLDETYARPTSFRPLTDAQWARYEDFRWIVP